MTQQSIYMHDFDSFAFLQNVVQTKLSEAQLHLKKLEFYKSHPDLLNSYTLDDIIGIHEEHTEFMTRVYNQCRFWHEQHHLSQYSKKIMHLETLTRTLESTTYHILYCIDQIQKRALADSKMGENNTEQTDLFS